MKYKNLFVLISLLLLASCSFFQKQGEQQTKVEFLPNTEIILPQPQDLALDFKTSQIVAATYHINGKDSNFTSQVEITADSKHIFMVALAGWGGSLFKMNYNGEKIDSSSLPMPNANMGVKQSLTEFIISFASIDVIEDMFADTDIKMEQKDKQRCLLKDNQKVLCVDYMADKPWLGDIVIHNYYYDYQIKIHTLSYSFVKDNG